MGTTEPKALERLLHQGQNDQRAVLGTMAEVVQQSLQAWRDDDIAAMREYLQQQARTKKKRPAKTRGLSRPWP